MAKKYEQVVQALQTAMDTVVSILTDPEDQVHLLNIESNLKRQIDRFSLLTGVGDINRETEKVVLGPATTIAGAEIPTRETVTASDLKPEPSKAEVLKAQVDETYAGFLNTTNDEILKIDHMVVRGVAKKAGLKVSKNEPKIITVDFIRDIKAAIEKEAADRHEKINGLETKIGDIRKQLEELPAEATADTRADLEAQLEEVTTTLTQLLEGK